MENEIKEIVDKISKDLDEKLFRARHLLVNDIEIVILEDFESKYNEVTIVKDNKAYLFGDDGEATISKKQFIRRR